MTVEIYPNPLSPNPADVRETTVRCSVLEWLQQNVKGFEIREVSPISAVLNGEPIDPADWALTQFGTRDMLRITVIPRGTDPFSITAALFAGAKAVFSSFMPKIPGTPKAPGQGDPFDMSNAKGNKVKLGDAIREVFGHRRIYPDYLLPQHRYFVPGSPREQWLSMLLCVGKGSYEIDPNGVRVGDTLLNALGADAEYTFYEPGASLLADPAATWWHTVTEVGASSTGSAGLELTESSNLTPNVTASSMQFGGFDVVIPVGAGSFPTDWAVGQVVRIVVPYTYTVTDGGAGVRDTITGPLAQVAPVAGMTIEVAGNNAGDYIVATYTATPSPAMTLNYSDGSPATGLTPGTGPASIGFRGLRYRITAITAQQITVQRLTSAGATDGTWPGFDALTTSSASISVDTTAGEAGWRGPFAACPDGEVCEIIEIDAFCPEGVAYINNNGDVRPRNIGYEVQYRAVGSTGAWTSLLFTHTGQTLDAQGYTEIITLSALMRPEVRVRQYYPNGKGGISARETVLWYGMRARLDGPDSYPGVTVMSVKIRSSDRLASQSENLISVDLTRKLPRLIDGAWTAPEPTREISAAFAYIAKSVGYTDADLDLVKLAELQAIWTARGETYDNDVSSISTVKENLNNSLGAGMGELTIKRGLISAVRDGVVTTLPTAIYSPQNNASALVRDFEVPRPDDFDGVDVEYTDGSSWTQETVQCRLPGDLGRKVEKITLPGVTSKTRAWRIGMRRRRIQKYRRDTFKWNGELDPLNSNYLDYVGLQDGVPGYGQSAILRQYAVSGGDTLLRVTEPFDWSGLTAPVVGLRGSDGRLAQAAGASPTADPYVVRMTGLLTFTPVVDGPYEPTHVLFGNLDKFLYPALVTRVQGNGSNSTQCEAVNYDARVYADDDNTPP